MVNQPSVYSYPQIIGAAFDLLREEGWGAVSTRAIAKRLGSSTMPIYSHVRSVAELEQELRRKARALLRDYQARQYTDDVLLNLAFGYIVFARDEKHLFRFLYLDRPEEIRHERGSGMKEAFLREFGNDSSAAAALAKMQDSGHETLIQYTWIFTHGLAMLVNSGTIKSPSDQYIMGLLRDAGEAFYTWGTRGTED